MIIATFRAFLMTVITLYLLTDKTTSRFTANDSSFHKKRQYVFTPLGKQSMPDN